MASKRIVFPAAGLAAVAVAAGGVVAASSSGSSHSSATPAANLYGGGMASTMAAPAQTPQSPPVAQAARGATLRLSADPHGQLRFNTSRLTAHAGTVRLVLTNPSSAGMPHGIAIRGNGVHSTGKIVGPGGTSTVTAKLKRGKYTFFCPVPGHAQAGMTGTLTVR
jgi:plastocyanin